MRTNANDRKIIKNISEKMYDLKERSLDAYYDIDDIRMLLDRQKNVKENLENLHKKTRELGEFFEDFSELYKQVCDLLNCGEIIQKVKKEPSTGITVTSKEVDFLGFLKKNGF